MTGSQFKQFTDALCSAFPDRGTLEQMVRVRLDRNLDEIVRDGGTLAEMIHDLVRWAEAHNLLGALAAGAMLECPGNPEVQALAAAMLGTVDTRKSRPATAADTTSLSEQFERTANALRDEIRGVEKRLTSRIAEVEKRLNASEMTLSTEIAAAYQPRYTPAQSGQWVIGFFLFIGCVLFLMSDVRKLTGVTDEAALLLTLPMFALSGFLLFSGLGFPWRKDSK